MITVRMIVLKLVDDFVASRYVSLAAKSSNFVCSITSRNLNQLKKISLVELA